MILTGFADEISDDPLEQLEVLRSEGIRYLELRGMWGINILKLAPRQTEHIKELLDAHGVLVSSIGSPIGKIDITDPFEPHMEEFHRAVALAKQMNAPYIRIFSFRIPQGDDPAMYREEVIRRMEALCGVAEKERIVLLHENEKHIYGDTGERCLDIMRTCNSPYLRCAFDPAIFVQCGVRPMSEAYPLLEPYVEYIHIKDARMGSGQVVPAGEGDGELHRLITALRDRSYSGFLSLEPHLLPQGPWAGYSKPQLFTIASLALQRLLVM